MRLQRIADYWVRSVPDRELARKCIWDEAGRAGLPFDRKQINEALRRAWNRTPDDERDALLAATTPAGPTPADAGASFRYVPPGQGPGRESRPGPGPGGHPGGAEGGAPAGAVPDFGAHEAETYELLARHEAGLLKPHPVALGPMPIRPTESMRAVAEDIALLLGLRLAVDDDRSLIYSARFCAWRMGWRILSGGWDKKRANRVINKLLEAGVIQWVGEMPGRKARLYAPPPLQLTVIRPGPEIPAVGVEARVKPGDVVSQQAVVDHAQAVLGEISGLSHPETAQRPGMTAPRRMPVGNCMRLGFHHRDRRDAIEQERVSVLAQRGRREKRERTSSADCPERNRMGRPPTARRGARSGIT